ncbi:MAG: VanZ family protein [Spirochaetales bacterium]|nr:VanZ family protein [Spirochaetales bacterium]
MDFTGTLIREFALLPKNWEFVLIIVALLSGLVLYLRYKKNINPEELFFSSLLASYIVFILYMTIIGRRPVTKRAEFIPFWSYVKPELWNEILLNYILFIPFGFLLYASHGDKREIRKKGISTVAAVFIGFLISSLIEINQFLFSIGLFEFDDIIGNTIGCYIGVMIERRLLSIVK